MRELFDLLEYLANGNRFLSGVSIVTSVQLKFVFEHIILASVPLGFCIANFTDASKNDVRRSKGSCQYFTARDTVMFHFRSKKPRRRTVRVNIAACTQAQRQDAYQGASLHPAS